MIGFLSLAPQRPAAGADPSGILQYDIADYSLRFIRGRYFQDDISYFSMYDPGVIVLVNARGKGIGS